MNSKPDNFQVPFRLIKMDWGEILRWITLHVLCRKCSASDILFHTDNVTIAVVQMSKEKEGILKNEVAISQW